MNQTYVCVSLMSNLYAYPLQPVLVNQRTVVSMNASEHKINFNIVGSHIGSAN